MSGPLKLRNAMAKRPKWSISNPTRFERKSKCKNWEIWYDEQIGSI